MAYLRRLVVGGALLTAATLCVFFSAGADRAAAAAKIADALPGSGDNIARFWSGRISAVGGRAGGLRRLGSVAGHDTSDGAATFEAAEESASLSDSSMLTSPASNVNSNVNSTAAGVPRSVELFDENGHLKRGLQRPVRSKAKRDLLPKKSRPGRGAGRPAWQQPVVALEAVDEPKPWGAELRFVAAQVRAICVALSPWTPLVGVAALSVAIGLVILCHRGLLDLRRRRTGRTEARAALVQKRRPMTHSGSDSTVATIGTDVELGSMGMAQSSSST